VTSAIAAYDIAGKGNNRNSMTGWIYIVKPKLRTAFRDTLKGACARGIYDNMKAAVETVFVGRDRFISAASCRYAGTTLSIGWPSRRRRATRRVRSRTRFAGLYWPPIATRLAAFKQIRPRLYRTYTQPDALQLSA
jgi:hypothetical protein